MPSSSYRWARSPRTISSGSRVGDRERLRAGRAPAPADVVAGRAARSAARAARRAAAGSGRGRSTPTASSSDGAATPWTPVPMPTSDVSSWKCRCGAQPPLTSCVAEHADARRRPRPRVPGGGQVVRQVAVEREERRAVVREVAQDDDAAEVERGRAAPRCPRRRRPARACTGSPAGCQTSTADVDGAALARVVGRERLAAVPAAALQVAARCGRSSRRIAFGVGASVDVGDDGALGRHGPVAAGVAEAEVRQVARLPVEPVDQRADRLLRDREVLVVGVVALLVDGMQHATSRAACGSGRRAAPARPAASGASSW